MSILAKEQIPIRFLTTEFIWEPDFPKAPFAEYFFFPKSTYLCKQFSLNQKIRRILRAVEYLHDIRRLKKLVKQFSPSIVHFNWSRLPSLDYTLIRFLKTLGIEVIYTAHNFLPHDTSKKYVQQFQRIYEEVDKIVTLTSYVKNCLVTEIGISANKIKIIPHPNFLPLLDAYHLEPPRRSKKLKTIIFYGQIHPYKGLDVLINACPLIFSEIPECILKICGNPYEDFSKYDKQIHQLKLPPEKVQKHLYYLSTEESINQLLSSDIVVLPYKRSSQSGVIPLATSLGIPVVGSAVGGIPEMIQEGVNGSLVPANDSVALAHKIINLLKDYQALEALKTNARFASEKIFPTEVIREKFLTLYKNC